MAISFNKFLDWAEKRFGDVVVSGKEIKLNSIFKEDYKHHMWCDVTGGIHKRKNGVFHCWKDDKSGSLITLVMIVDKCSYDEAIETLGLAIDPNLDDKINALFYDKIELKEEKSINDKEIKIPDFSFKINELPEDSHWRINSEYYLINRNIKLDKFYVCIKGEYKNRIIIPYYDRNKKLIYFNARTLSEDKNTQKYMGPNKECGIGKSDVIYMAGENWPNEGEEIFLTEGEFDAEALKISNVNGVAIGGKEIYDKQIEYIRNYIPAICVDTDKPGDKALLKIGDKLISQGFKNLYYVRPPKIYKDWNEMLNKTSSNIIYAYLQKEKKRYDEESSLKIRLNRIKG